MSNLELLVTAAVIIFIVGCIAKIVLTIIHGNNIQNLPVYKLPAYIEVVKVIPDTVQEPRLPSIVTIDMEVPKLPVTK